MYIAVAINDDKKAIATNPLGCISSRLAEAGEGSCIFETVKQKDCGNAIFELLPLVDWHSSAPLSWPRGGEKDSKDSPKDALEVNRTTAFHGCSVQT